MIRILLLCGIFLIGCCPARNSSGNYWKTWQVYHRAFAKPNRMYDTNFPLPWYADTANGIIAHIHWHSQPSGDGDYDEIGRLVRVNYGRLPLWEMVWDHGKWVPYAQSSYCKSK